jgi:endonuclease-3
MSADRETRSQAKAIYRILCKTYPNIRCELDFSNPLQLLVATVLSAQCTDKRVNMVTPVLFKKYPTVVDLAAAPIEDIESIIRSTGFYHNKALSIKGLSAAIIERFDGEVPNTLEELVTLPGAGRKTANVVLGNAFGVPGVTVDTHVGRIARRFGWTKNTDPVKVEFDIMAILPPEYWTMLNHRLIFLGRRVCHSRKPACGACELASMCPSFGEGPTDPTEAAKLVKTGD